MSAPRYALAAALPAATLAAIVWASHAPIRGSDSSSGVIRLAWSARPERVERCRQPAEQEQASLPRHMRQSQICEGAAATYRLQVHYNGALIADQLVQGGGLRRDRRLYVFRELALPPGDALVQVRFERTEAPAAGSLAGENRGADMPGGASGGAPGVTTQTGRGDAVPARLRFDERLHMAPGQVILVTYDPRSRSLVAVRK